MSEKCYPLDLGLWEAACAENATRSEIERWIYHLVDVLRVVGVDAKIVRDGFGRILEAEDQRKSIDGISGQLELEGLFDLLANLGIQTEIYPGLCMNVTCLEDPAGIEPDRPAFLPAERYLEIEKDPASFHGAARPLPSSRPNVASA